MCEKHLQEHGNPRSIAVGTKFELHDAPQSEKTEVVTGIEETSLEDVLMDREMRHVGCPECGFSHPMEPDAAGQFECHGCGVKINMIDPLEMLL
jgi:hypothetical protein